MQTSNFLYLKKHYAEQSKQKLMNHFRRREEAENPPKRENNKSPIQNQKTGRNTTHRQTPSVAKSLTPDEPGLMAPAIVTNDLRHTFEPHNSTKDDEMRFPCPKKEDGCSLTFAGFSALYHHLRMNHNGALPISHNNVRRKVTAGSASQAMPGVPGQNIASIPNPSVGKRYVKSSKSLAPGVSKNGRIKKQPKKEPPKMELSSFAFSIPTCLHALPSQFSEASVEVKKRKDIVNTNSDGLFEGMGASYLDQFPLSCLDLPPPEEFFAETSAAKSGSDAK